MFHDHEFIGSTVRHDYVCEEHLIHIFKSRIAYIDLAHIWRYGDQLSPTSGSDISEVMYYVFLSASNQQF